MINTKKRVYILGKKFIFYDKGMLEDYIWNFLNKWYGVKDGLVEKVMSYEVEEKTLNKKQIDSLVKYHKYEVKI